MRLVSIFFLYFTESSQFSFTFTFLGSFVEYIIFIYSIIERYIVREEVEAESLGIAFSPVVGLLCIKLLAVGLRM